MNDFEEITKEEFESYVECQESGETNMFHVGNVEELSGLPRTKILTIMKNYSKLRSKYGYS